MIKKIKEFVEERVIKEYFWIYPSQKKLLDKEVKKNGWKNRSELMRHIITGFFKK